MIDVKCLLTEPGAGAATGMRTALLEFALDPSRWPSAGGTGAGAPSCQRQSLESRKATREYSIVVGSKDRSAAVTIPILDAGKYCVRAAHPHLTQGDAP